MNQQIESQDISFHKTFCSRLSPHFYRLPFAVLHFAVHISKNLPNMSHRRTFLQQSLSLSAFAFLPHALWTTPARERKFKLSLQPGNIGVQASQTEQLDMAIRHGYEVIAPYPTTLAEMEPEALSEFLGKMKAARIGWGSAGLPIEFRKDEATFRNDLQALPRQAAALAKVGGTRMHTWIMPTHDTRTYRVNFALHQQRLGEVAQILGHYGIQLGLEYVGPKTLMARDRYSFLRTMAEAQELIHAMDATNIGLVLDSFHWYCAEESAADILTLLPQQIVAVDLNDARTGFTPATQVDGKRELPGATGVIDMKAFIGALLDIGYDGPVRAEPFNQELREMEDEAALAKTAKMMRAVWET